MQTMYAVSEQGFPDRLAGKAGKSSYPEDIRVHRSSHHQKGSASKEDMPQLLPNGKREFYEFILKVIFR